MRCLRSQCMRGPCSVAPPSPSTVNNTQREQVSGVTGLCCLFACQHEMLLFRFLSSPPPFLFLALLVGLVLVCLYASVPSHPKRQLLLETVPLPHLLVCSCVCVFLSFFLSFFLFFFSFCFCFNCTKQQQHQHAVQGEGEGCVSERRRARAST